MCGIVSLAYKDENPSMGKEAEALLKRLEYRGYDSTGASFIGDDKRVTLRKQVGAPSKVCPLLHIDQFTGQRFIGQVRWATYGSVTDVNSQPHHVRCKIELVGAHNGNISNTDTLKAWLTARGHAVVSDNDGEIIVHLIEEHYAAAQSLASSELAYLRRAYANAGLAEGVSDGVLRMIEAIRKAESLTEGSYAAAIADPQLPGVFAIKSGSSLYAGMGSDSHGEFIVLSSDLTSVLSKTRALIPLSEGEGIWFTEKQYLVFSLQGQPFFSHPRLKRSKLSVKDTQLLPEYQHYMEQEISSSPNNISQVLRYYFRDPAVEPLSELFEERKDECKETSDVIASLSERFGNDALLAGMHEVFRSPAWNEIEARVQNAGAAHFVGQNFTSDETELLKELAALDPQARSKLLLMDKVMVWRKRRAILRYTGELKNAIHEAARSGGRIYLVASGTSYHAALTAAYFFNQMAHIPVYPCNPGIFRSMYFNCLGANDLIIGISQSGETKDLVDIFQDVKKANVAVRLVSIVNNENSRIPQELSDFYLPLLCGPEIAVAATKSFTSQIAILYLIAASFSMPEQKIRDNLLRAKELMTETIETRMGDIETVAAHLYAAPSLHILGTGLIGLAREGALKIREVVLNHTEGYDAAEFKHGPNTILGRNTILSLADIEKLVGKDPVPAITNELFGKLTNNYPLVFICPPEERDRRITISQIHTHKIRGADIVLIAEPQQELALAVEGRPMGMEKYWSKYIPLPQSGDPCLFVFSATIVLQYLAYRMSVRKMEWLDSLGIENHGVHPDAPKNVSKSITVD